MWLYLLLLCFTDTLGCRSNPDKKNITKNFTNGAWKGWYPKDDSWKDWVKVWAQENNSVAFDSTEVGKDPESGWPRYWKGIGFGNKGVPVPPWAYVPENYGKPNYCFMIPDPGNCENFMLRWGFNPISNSCERFLYTGCGGNENNFWTQYDCKQACAPVPETGCASMNANFRDFIGEFPDSRLNNKE